MSTQQKAAGLVGAAAALLFLNWAFGGIVGSWFQLSGGFLGRWIVPTISLVLILVALHIAGIGFKGWLVFVFFGLMAVDLLIPWASGWFKTRYNQDTGEIQTMMDSVTGEEVRSLSPEICAQRPLGYCIDGETGHRYEVFDPTRSAALQRVVRESRRDARTGMAVANNFLRDFLPTVVTVAPRLDEAAYLDQTYGRFAMLEIEPGASNRIGPVTNFDGDSLCHTKSGGMGDLVIWTRADFESEPVRATLARDGLTIVSYGHAGAPWQMFYGAEERSINLVLEREDTPNSC